jgi:reticulon-4-interacting protein 1, mitochondrial
MKTIATSSAVMCLGPKSGGALEVCQLPRKKPGKDEIEVALEAAAVNPIDVGRSQGYGHRLLLLLGAAKFPLVLGNDFAGTVTAGGAQASAFNIGDRVYGVKAPSARGTHACHVVVKAAHARLAPAGRDLRELAALPYSFVTMWLAAHGAGLTRENAAGKKVLVHGAGGGLGILALQALSKWGATVTAMTWPSAFAACLKAGAVETVDATARPFSMLSRSFDATLNFATWDDDLALLGCLREGALGHATTVHPLLRNFDDLGRLAGALKTLQQRKRGRAALPAGARNYAWTVFRPDKNALAELDRLVGQEGLSLPIGLRAPLAQAGEAFDHVKNGRPGRALILPS